MSQDAVVKPTQPESASGEPGAKSSGEETLPTLGRYGLVSEIGRGTMGVVFRAIDPLIGRTVALKAFQISFPISAEEAEVFRKRFLLEGQIIGQLKHPNIVVVHDVGVGGPDSVPYIAMELVDGTNLEDEIVKGRPPSLERSLEFVGQLAGALAYAHGLGVVHRDIKPANVLITTDGVPKIVDFGVARISRVKLTGDAKVFGSPAYMSPEQIVGEEVDGRSDLFSLGILLYILVTGEHPFPGEDLASVAYKVLYQDPPLPSTRRRAGEVGSLDPVVMKSLAKKREDRYQTGGEMARAVDALRVDLGGQPLGVSGTSSEPVAPVTGTGPVPAARPRWRGYALAATVVFSWTIAAMAGAQLYFARLLEDGPGEPPAFVRSEHAEALLPPNAVYELPPPVKNPGALLAELLRVDREGEKEPASVPTPTPAPTPEPPKETPKPRPASPRSSSPAASARARAAEPAKVLENRASSATPHIPVGIMTPSILKVDFDHHLSSGEIQILVDGKRVLVEPLQAKPTRTLIIIPKHNEQLKTSVTVAAGRHKVGVRVVSPELEIDETREIYVTLSQGVARTLKVRYGRMFGGLTLEIKD